MLENTSNAIQPTGQQEVLKKPNEFLVMVPKNGKKLPVVARKLYNAMLSVTQGQMQEMRDLKIDFNAGYFFSHRLSDLTQAITVNKSNTLGLVQEYLQAMGELTVDWRQPDANSPIIWKNLTMLAESRIEKRGGALWVQWAYPPTLFDAIRDMRVYTKLNLPAMAHLTTYASVSLYEICARYKHNPSGVTSMQAPDWWVDALTSSEPRISKETGLPLPRREWRKVKDSHLPNALEEINKYTDIVISLVESKEGSKSGKAVTGVQFTVTLKKSDRPSMARNISKELAEQAGKTDVPLSTISSLLSLGRSETAVMYGLRKLENRLSSSASHLKPLDNKIAYLKACIEDADGRIHADNSPAPSEIAKEKAPEPIKEILSWEDTRRVEVKDEFLKLTTAEQKVYVLATAERLKENRMWKPLFQRRIDEENWQSGPLLMASAEQYARTKYGADWINNATSVQ